MPRKTLEQEVREFFEVGYRIEDFATGKKTKDVTAYEWGDGRDATPFVRRLIRAAKLQDVIDADREARGSRVIREPGY